MADATRAAATVRIPAACGELFQGTLDGVPCLVSCPIDLYGAATVTLDAGGDRARLPLDSPKATQALRHALRALGAAPDAACLQLEGSVSRSRGYGSSTIDVGATIHAAACAAGTRFSDGDAVGLATAVEPTNSTMLPGLALLDHLGATTARCLGPAPRIRVLVVDPGGGVETVAYNRVDRSAALRALAGEHRRTLQGLEQAIGSGDLLGIGEAATRSARLHQEMLFSDLLDDVVALAESVGALGVCRAHSGTILGILLDPEVADCDAIADHVRRAMSSRATVTSYALVDGGPRYDTQGVR